MSNENQEFNTEPIPIQDAIAEEVDRLEQVSQAHYNAQRAEQDEKVRQHPELFAIEEEIDELRHKAELSDEETHRLTELRERYDRLIQDRDTD